MSFPTDKTSQNITNQIRVDQLNKTKHSVLKKSMLMLKRMN